jgi:hypothetical protein
MQLTDLLTRLANTPVAQADQETFRYSDPYVQIEAEFKKIGSLYNEKPDYPKVVKLAAELIQQGCNHFSTYTLLAYAMCQVYQWPGFIESIALIDRKLRTQWAQLFPSAERLRGRIAPMQGLSDRWQKFLTNKSLQGLSPDIINKLVTSLKNLDAICTERFADQINIISILAPFEAQQKRLEHDRSEYDARQKAEAERERQAQEAKAHSQKVMAELETHAEPLSTEALFDAINTQELHDAGCKRLLAEHLTLLHDDPFNYAIYKHNRAEMWWRHPYRESELLDLIDQQGLAWDAYCAAMLEKAKNRPQDALLLFEQLSHAHPFFLDLQLHISDCLVALHAEAPLIKLIKHEVQELCRIYPGLEHARINREVAVIDLRTKAYFEVFIVNE